MITFPIAKLPGNHRKFIGVRSASNDMMLHGLFLRDDFKEDYMRVTVEQAEEICRQLCEERRKINAEHEARRFPHEELTAKQPPTQLEKLETIPLQGEPDGWPRTKDGWLARPGMQIQNYAFAGTIRTIYKKGPKNYMVEVETTAGDSERVWLRFATLASPALQVTSLMPPPSPPKVDMDKVAKALKEIPQNARPRHPKLDLEKALKVARSLIGSSIPETEQIRPPAPPADGGRRTYTTKARKGCSGFNHPNFHP